MSNITIQGKLNTDRSKVQEIYSDSDGKLYIYMADEIAGEEGVGTSNDYLKTHQPANYTVIDLSVATPVAVSSGVPAFLCGLYVDTALSAHAVTVDDDSTTVVTIPASTAVGAFDFGNQGHDVRFNTALVVTPNASSTGVLVVYWRPI